MKYIFLRYNDKVMQVLLKKVRKIFYKLFLLPSVNRKYVREPVIFESIISADPKKLFVVTVAFNEHELVELHHRSLKKYLRDDYEYFVIDNSTKEDETRETKAYCLKERVNYVRLPKNPGIDGSIHHGLGLNWTYQNIIKRYKPARFGFIDFDLYLTREINITSHLDHADAWGILTERRRPFLPFLPHMFYFWIGLAFFRAERFHKNDPNFLPAWGVDTGGRIRVDGEAAKRLPDVHHHLTSPIIEIAPNVRVWQYGAFVHFTGVTWESPDALAVKKKWMRSILQT